MGFDAANRLARLRELRATPRRERAIGQEVTTLRAKLGDQRRTGSRAERAWRSAAPEAFALGAVVSSVRIRLGVLTVWLSDASQQTAIERWGRREGIAKLASAGLSVQRIVVKRGRPNPRS